MLLSTDDRYEAALRTVIVSALVSPYFVLHDKTPHARRRNEGAGLDVPSSGRNNDIIPELLV